MSEPVPTSNFSATDAAFLYLERKEVPLHIASVCIFDGPISFKKFAASVIARLPLVPRYRQIPVVQPWNLGFPTWQDDPDFDIHNHVIPVSLAAPGDVAELEELTGHILSELLDRNKPLWDVHVVDGLKDGRGALIWRVHHSLADGVSGSELMKIMMDPTPEAPVFKRKPRHRGRRPAAKPVSLANEISGAVNSALGSLLGLEADLLAFTKHLLGSADQTALKKLVELFPEYTASVERLPFNKPCTGARKFCWTEWDLTEVQAIREAIGGTVNDVILAVVTRAIARYVKLHDQSVVNRYVRIVCPVSLRQADENNGPGNQISFLPVALPLDARGPARMLQAVASRTDTLKRCGALGFVGLAAKWFASAPPPLHALFWRSIPEIILPVPLLNMICTNVVGSPTPLYAAGRRMLAAYPQVPTGWDLGVGCAVHSYDGKLFFGLIADTHAAPDVDRLRDFLILSFDELSRAAAQKKSAAEKKTARPRKQKKVKAEAAASAVPEGSDSGSSAAPPERVVVRAGEAA